MVMAAHALLDDGTHHATITWEKHATNWQPNTLPARIYNYATGMSYFTNLINFSML
jgi:hypothetical protein